MLEIRNNKLSPRHEERERAEAPKRGSFLCSIAVLLLFLTNLYAGPSEKFTYQGNLRQSGLLVNGTRSMVFKLYASSEAAVPLWTSPVKDVQVSTGVFRVELEPAGLNWESGELWLELEVEGVTLSPREEITSTPYAIDSLLHSGKKYTTSDSEPSSPSAGDLWMDTSENTLKFWTGVMWQDTALAGDPGPHAPTHAEGGGDEITSLGPHNVTGPLTLEAGSTIQAGIGAMGIFISTDVYLSAGARYYGDGSGLTGITAENADTLDLLHATDFMRSSGNLSESVTGAKTFVSSLTVASLDGIFSPSLKMTDNVRISSALAADYGGIFISTNVFASGKMFIGSTTHKNINYPRMYVYDKHKNIPQLEMNMGFSSYDLGLKLGCSANSDNIFGFPIANSIQFERFYDGLGYGNAIENNYPLGGLVFSGYDGAKLQVAAAIASYVDGETGIDDMPGRLVFYTTPDGAKDILERMRITNQGYIGISTGVPQGLFAVKDDFVVKSDGNVGISSTVPTNTLAVEGGIVVSSSITAQGGFYGDGSALTGVVASEVPESIAISTMNATATTPYGGINITTNTFIQGNLGIGILNPLAKLEVKGSDLLKYNLAVGTSSAYNMVVSTGGNVGIGTQAPAAKMDVAGTENPGEYIMIFRSGSKISAWLRNK